MKNLTKIFILLILSIFLIVSISFAWNDCTPLCEPGYILVEGSLNCPDPGNVSLCSAVCEKPKICNSTRMQIGNPQYSFAQWDDVAIAKVNATFDIDARNPYCSGTECFTEWCYDVEFEVNATMLEEGNESEEDFLGIRLKSFEFITEDCNFYNTILNKSRQDVKKDGVDVVKAGTNYTIYPYNSSYNDCGTIPTSGYFSSTFGAEKFEGISVNFFGLDYITIGMKNTYYARPFVAEESYTSYCEREIDILIKEIIPIQVVRNVDLVKGKTTLVRTILKNNDTVDGNVIVELYYEDLLKNSTTAFVEAGTEENVDMYFVPDSAGENKEIRVEVMNI